MNRTLLLIPWLAVLMSVFAAAATPRPNILLVVADDLGYADLGCYGHPEIQTPNLDQLARDGLRLTSYYSAAPNCSPARAGLMTGRTPYRVGIYNQLAFMTPLHLRKSEVTIATLLRQAGYATAQVGKWHLNGFFNLPGQPQPGDHGFEHWFAVQNNALPNHRNPYNFVRNGIPLGPIDGYSGHIVADEAVKWLASGRDKTKPFLLYVAFNEPHEPIATDPRHEMLYKTRHPDDPSRVAYYGNVTQMDAALGRILRALEAERVAENTLVWFVSDNGPARTRWHAAGSTGGFREYKGHLYEGGIRVPGIVRWPGRIRAGATSDTPVIGTDILPTICAAVGISPPADRALDGANVMSLFNGGSVARSKPLYWEFIYVQTGPQVAIRHGKWKLLASFEGTRPRPVEFNAAHATMIKRGKPTGFQLYDLEADPGETRDLAATQPERLAAVRRELETMHADVSAEAPDWPEFIDPRYEQERIKWPEYVAKRPK